MATLTPNHPRHLTAGTPKSPRSPGRALIATQAKINFAPNLTQTIFANDAALKQTLNQDMAGIDFALRQLLSASAERRRAHDVELHDLVDEGKRVEQDRARVQDAARHVTATLERERAEANAAQTIIKDLESRKADMAAQLDALRSDIIEWEGRITKARSNNAILQEKATREQAANSRKLSFYEKTLGLTIRGNGADIVTFAFSHINPAAFGQIYQFDLHIATQIYAVSNCSPNIPSSTITQNLAQLNETRDLNNFTKIMRDAFVDTLPANALAMRKEIL